MWWKEIFSFSTYNSLFPSFLVDLVRDNFFLVTDTYRRAVFQVDLQSTLEPKALYLPSIQNPIAVSFDPIDRKVYWTDVGSQTLSRASLDGNNYQVIARDGVERKFVLVRLQIHGVKRA